MDYDILRAIILTLAIGFAVGMQRTLSRLEKGKHSFAGSRTFALISLSGYLSGWIAQKVEGFVLLSFAVIGLLLAISYYLKVTLYDKRGMTTHISAMLVYILGLMIFLGFDQYAVFIGVVTIVLLELKPRLQRIESRISRTDIDAVVLLLLMSFVILPVLPHEMIGPYKLFNPYKTWLMAVIIAGISFVGYVAIKIAGESKGVLITGAAGGLISSTGVSVSLSKLYKNAQGSISSYAAGIAIACTIMYIRVLIEAAIIDPQIAWRLTYAYIPAFLVGLLYSWLLYRDSKEVPGGDIMNSEIAKNPLQLSEAVKFGILFGIVYGAVAFVKSGYGDVGVYIVSFLSGITDVDAITLSLSQLAKSGELDMPAAMSGIVIASVVNSLVKLGIVFWMGGKDIGWMLTKFFILSLGVMVLGLVGKSVM